jgi:hypothetical protein
MPLVFKVIHTYDPPQIPPSGTHYVVVTGSATQVGYTINDPGNRTVNSLADGMSGINGDIKNYYSSYKALIRFRPSDGNDNYSALSIRAYPGD